MKKGNRVAGIEAVKSLAVAIGMIETRLQADGISVRTSSDFKALAGFVGALDEKELSAQFSLDHFELYAQNAFWLYAFDVNDICRIISCHRVEELGSRPLCDHWSDQQTRIYPKPNLIGSNHAPLATEISGRVTYTGDFWAHPDHRKTEEVWMIALYGLMLIQMWRDPDWTYAFMAPELVDAGFANRSGFDFCQPFATDWTEEPVVPGLSGSNWLVATKRNAIEHRAHLIAKHGLSGYRRKRKT